MIRTAFQHRVVAAWILWASAMMLNAFVGVLVQRYFISRGISKVEVLFDIGFELLPYIPSKSLGFSLPDLCTLLSATMMAKSLIVTFPPHLAVILLRRVLCISAIAYFGRAISVPLTLLPNPDGDCVPHMYPENIFLTTLLVPFGARVTCADVFYSGHTIPITCAILMWKDYMRFNRLRVFGMLASWVSLLGIIVTHFHYTVDVFYGMVVTYLIWRLYHYFLTVPSVLLNSPILLWFEQADSMGDLTGRSPLAGVFPIDFSRDPRIAWSFTNKNALKREIQSRLSPTQLALLLVVALSLSPSWIALFTR